MPYALVYGRVPRPVVYFYSTAVDLSGDPEDAGWWIQCCPCPAATPPMAGVDWGPYKTASQANDNALMHINIQHWVDSDAG